MRASRRLLVPLALTLLLVGGRFALAKPPSADAEVDADPASRDPGDLTGLGEDELAMPKHHLGAAKIVGDLDANHDGKISREELVARLKQVNKEFGDGIQVPDGTSQELSAGEKEYFASVDKDGDKFLSLDEFLAERPEAGMEMEKDATAAEKAMHTQMAADMAKESSSEFKAADKNRDGKLAFEEFTQHLGSTNAALEPISEHNVVEFGDKDGDGRLSLSEFIAMFDVPTNLHDPSVPADVKQEHTQHVETIKAEHTALFEKFDRDGDGQLSKAEYRALDHEGQLVGSDPGATHDAQSALQYDEADQAADILTRADKNGDGFISAGEVDASGLGWETHPHHDGSEV